MNKIEYLYINNREVIFHEYPGGLNSEIAILMLNPLFEEKKRSHRFQTEVSFELSRLGNKIFRFDYYGTGDSGGELYDFDLDQCLEDINYIIDYILLKKGVKQVILFGIRFGADISIYYTSLYNKVNKLILFEPIFNGKRYLLELRTRRQMFFSLNKMGAVKTSVIINNKYYEDLQGFLLSEDLKNTIENWKWENIELLKKEVLIFKINNNKYFKEIHNLFNAENKLLYKELNGANFWNSLEIIDYTTMIKELTDNISEFFN